MDRIERVAQEVFGFTRLRDGQREAIEALLAGRDTLAVMSTGYGKSAIYQIAALLLEGPAVVVSPLIALQRDQVEELDAESAGLAAGVNSLLPASERRQALEELSEDELKFAFFSPEQLSRDDVLARAAESRPALFVVDEAHCISEWGHDFRPDYLHLGAVCEALGRPPIVALTATAAPPVRDEIVGRLAMREPDILVRGFDRPNIWLGVERYRDDRSKREAIVERIAAEPKPGIVYSATRRHVEELAHDLGEAGVPAAGYHGGMRKRERVEVQEHFMSGALDVIVATTAFGMGVDKADVRFVFHSEPSDSVDSYYQEVGRSGRDGEPARAVLFFREQDLGLRRFFAGGGQVDEEQLRLVAGALADSSEPVPPSQLQEETSLSQSKLMTAVTRLEDVGAVDVLPTGDVAAAALGDDLDETVERAAQAEQERMQFDRSRVAMMESYADTTGCRREFILSYFGEVYEPPCGNCDNCDAGLVSAERAALPFELGAAVVHNEWGEGVVQRYERDRVVVLFDSVGYKTLGVDLVAERGLLRPAGGDG